ncbi:hypothetical protein FTUN_5998 [Frigoriglobus tundricola]|uniref:Uncharacterized protein n=1 Tax=Frigoriglobus tundricola TaxID=2774151 RepID=A0A6M5YWV1_9BACT|nr:hypothetical protein FTUN_5998 [Frigoriglobus tundricola]
MNVIAVVITAKPDEPESPPGHFESDVTSKMSPTAMAIPARGITIQLSAMICHFS